MMFPSSYQGRCPRKAWHKCCTTAAYSASSRAWTSARANHGMLKLPPVTFSLDSSTICAEELADLFAQVACNAPCQAFHALDRRHGQVSLEGSTPPAVSSMTSLSSSSSNSSSSSTSTASSLDLPLSTERQRRLRLTARVERALQYSSVCVAAFASEHHLPQHQHLASRGLKRISSDDSKRQWRVQRQPRRVLVGFARAVSDAAFVATVHDLAVLPELQGLGLGRQLLQRLTGQLWREGIVDVGLLAPTSAVGFFERCSWGPDPEESTTMALTAAGKERWLAPDWEFEPRPGLRELLLRV